MANVRLLAELAILAMGEVQFQVKCLQTEQIVDRSVHVRELVDALNKAQYYIGQLEVLSI